jgi:hypothetical protein
MLRYSSPEEVKDWFTENKRIVKVDVHVNMEAWGANFYAIVTFTSHSAARKSLEGFKYWSTLTLQWMNINGEVVGEIKSRIKKARE